MGDEGTGEVYNLDFKPLESKYGFQGINILIFYWFYCIPGVQGENNSRLEILSA
jgi:hypothetical protein